MKGFSFLLFALVLVLGQSLLHSSDGKRPIRLAFVQSVNLEANFLGTQAVWADDQRIFGVTYEGGLIVLKRERNGKLVKEKTHLLSSQPLTAVTGHFGRIFVVGNSGDLWIFSAGNRFNSPQLLLGPTHHSEYGLANVAAAGGRIYVGKGQGQVTADIWRVYQSALNEGEFALELNLSGEETGRIFGETFVPGATSVFNRLTGAHLADISNPGTVALYDSFFHLFLTVPGPVNTGIYEYHSDLKLKRIIDAPYANDVERFTKSGRDLLVCGTAIGRVELYNLNSGKLVASLDLRALTGNTNLDIRAITVVGNSIYAASSWDGNLDTPTMFVLEVD